MTEEQINAIIATSLGFIEEEPWLDGRRCWVHIDYPNSGLESIPDFCNDLNACHEFEKMLDDDLDLDYSENLELVTGTRWGANNSYDMSKYRSATARQRCESYLKTIGKWIE